MTIVPNLALGPSSMPHSGIREIIHMALERKGTIRLEVGEPDFSTPPTVLEAVQRFIADGHVKYVGTAGIPELRERLSAKLASVNGISAHASDICVSAGGIGAIANAFIAILDPGDEVLLPDPAWPCYDLMIAMTNARGVHYACLPENGFLPRAAEIEALITPRTKLIVLNSPNNPTGAVYPRTLIEAILNVADRHGIFVLSDECYDEVVFSAEHASAAAIAGTDRVLTVMSFSKTYAMTGWRVGYLAASPSLIEIVNKVQEGNISCMSVVSQVAAVAALESAAEIRARMVASYAERRDLCVTLLRRHGMLINEPEGAFYIMADISRSRMNARDFAMRLLDERLVAVAPGTAFGTRAPHAVRISLASSLADLSEGIERLASFLNEAAA